MIVKNENHFDIIIAGAGISGLLIASELSKSMSVLVIESKEKLEANKFWVTLSSCLELNPHLKNCVDSYFNKMEFSDAYQNVYELKGEYILWKTNDTLNYLANSVLSNKGKIYYSQRFCGYATENLFELKNHKVISLKRYIELL